MSRGADDLVARPISATQLAERLRSHILRCEGFVIMADYIGPDRRRDPSRSGTECFEVPNTLKLRRDVFELCAQWRSFDQ